MVIFIKGSAKTMSLMHGCVHIIIGFTRLYIIIYECVCHKLPSTGPLCVCVCVGGGVMGGVVWGGGGGCVHSCASGRACVCVCVCVCVCCLVYSVSLWVLCITGVEMGHYLLITLNRKFICLQFLFSPFFL